MNKQHIFILRLTVVFAVLAVCILTACADAAPFDTSAAPSTGPGPVIGSEQTERYANAAVTATAQAIAVGIPPRLPAEWIPRGCSVSGHSFRFDHRLPWVFVFPGTPNYGDQVLRCRDGYRILYWDVWRDQGKPDDRNYHEVSAPMIIGCWHDQVREDVVAIGVHDSSFPEQRSGSYKAWLTERRTEPPTTESLFIGEAEGDSATLAYSGG
jgi:hypothetical protein